GMGGVYNLVNLQLYHYAGNNPVKYIDPDGRINKFSWFLKMITTPYPLDAPPKIGSFYFAQFISEQESMSGYKLLTDSMGLFPFVLPQFFSWMGTAAELNEKQKFKKMGYSPDRIVVFSQRKAFLRGAEMEIKRIYNLLGDIDEKNIYSSGFRFFLLSEIAKLEYEIRNNKFYDKYESEKKRHEFYEAGGGLYADYEDKRDKYPTLKIKPVDYWEEYLSLYPFGGE
ncbi:hypothetical protein WKV44_10575, partial [Spirochaetia bacterium 38H-sp]